ncbi:glycosyl hydrolase [soil metagenome]
MKEKIILSTNQQGISRAIFQDNQWLVSKVLSQDVRCLAQHKVYEEVIYAGTQQNGVYLSEDKGISWSWLGLEKQTVKSITTSSYNPESIYAGIKPANIFFSPDKGKSWQESNSFRRNPQQLSWFSPAEPPFTAYVLGLDLSPTHQDEIIAGIEYGGIHLSTDGGKTWKGHMEGAIKDCHNLKYHRTKGQYVYEGGGVGAGAAISRDGGRSWEQDKQGLDRHYGWAVAADPADPEIWYSSLSKGPMKAHGGKNAKACIFRKRKNQPWEKLKLDQLYEFKHMPYSLICTDEPGFIAAGFSNGSIWWSVDYGDYWQEADLNLGVLHSLILI